MRTLDELTFNHALPYLFQIEAVDEVPQELQHLTAYGQYTDFLEGYLFAQETALPTLRQFGLESITPEIVVDLLRQLHRRFAYSMLNYIPKNIKSGEYLDSLVTHWHHGSQMQNEIAIYLAGLNPDCKTESQMVAYVGREYPFLDKNDVVVFIRLARTMMNDETGFIHPSYLKNMIDDNGVIGKIIKGFCRMATAWHENTLSVDQRRVVAKFVSFVRYPDLMPASMLSFARDMLEKWKVTNTNDVNEFSLFLAKIYQQLVTIHPFPNANKRTARCWLNVMLRFSGHNDIVLTHREQKNYSENENTQIVELAADIREGLVQAANPKPLSEEEQVMKKLYSARIAIFYILKQLYDLNPKYRFAKIFSDGLSKIPLINSMDHNAATSQLIANQLILVEAQKALELQQKAIKDQKVLTTSSVTTSVQNGFFNSVVNVKTCLKEISGKDGWKVSSDLKNIWIECKEESEAIGLIKRIEEKQFCKPELKKRSDTGAAVVLLTAVDFSKISSPVVATSSATL